MSEQDENAPPVADEIAGLPQHTRAERSSTCAIRIGSTRGCRRQSSLEDVERNTRLTGRIRKTRRREERDRDDMCVVRTLRAVERTLVQVSRQVAATPLLGRLRLPEHIGGSGFGPTDEAKRRGSISAQRARGFHERESHARR